MPLQRGCDDISFTAIFQLIQIIRHICTGVNTVVLFVYINGINTSCRKTISKIIYMLHEVQCKTNLYTCNLHTY